MQGFDPKMIPHQKEFLFLQIVQGKGENPVEPGQKVQAEDLVGFQQHLGVGVGPEPAAHCLQLLADLPEIIDFPVEDDAPGPTGVEHRLVSRFQVDDGKPPMPQDGILVPEHRLCVRPPVGQYIQHPVHQLRPVCVLFYDADDSAHTITVDG